MPYIKKENRRLLDNRLAHYFTGIVPTGLMADLSVRATSAGDLNYIFTKMAHQYILDNGLSYQTFNDIIGALEGAKLELYRRKVSEYEDLKISENGDLDE